MWILVRGKTSFPWQFQDVEGAEMLASQLNTELRRNYSKPYAKMKDDEIETLLDLYKVKEVQQ